MASVYAVHKHPTHQFSKQTVTEIHLQAGAGVIGDAHCGELVKHRSRVQRDPNQPNLRQVHLLPLELLETLQAQGFPAQPGTVGENITTRELDLLSLPTGTELKIGTDVVLRLTGLRNPCAQLDNFAPGLTAAVLDRNDDGTLIRKAGVMAVVVRGGTISKTATIQVTLPAAPHLPLAPV